MSAILKQKLIDIANGFTKYGLWKGGGSGGSALDCETVIVEQFFESTKDYTFSFTKNFSSIDTVIIGNAQPKATWNSAFLAQVNPFTYDTSAKTITLNITSPSSQIYNISIVILGKL